MSPAGILGHYVNRIHVLVAGAAVWGTMCLCFSTAQTVGQGYPFWALNGIGAALGWFAWFAAAVFLRAPLLCASPAGLKGRMAVH